MSESNRALNLPPELEGLMEQMRRVQPMPLSIQRDEMLFQMALARARTPMTRIWPVLAIVTTLSTVVLSVLLMTQPKTPLPIILKPAPPIPQEHQFLGKSPPKRNLDKQKPTDLPKPVEPDTSSPLADPLISLDLKSSDNLVASEEEQIARLKRNIEIHQNVLKYGLGLLPSEPLQSGSLAIDPGSEIAPWIRIPAGTFLSPRKLSPPTDQKKDQESEE